MTPTIPTMTLLYHHLLTISLHFPRFTTKLQRILQLNNRDNSEVVLHCRLLKLPLYQGRSKRSLKGKKKVLDLAHKLKSLLNLQNRLRRKVRRRIQRAKRNKRSLKNTRKLSSKNLRKRQSLKLKKYLLLK